LDPDDLSHPVNNAPASAANGAMNTGIARSSRQSAHSLMSAENSLLVEQNSLFGRVGNLTCKALITKGKFGRKIASQGRFRENSLLNSLQPGNFRAATPQDGGP
jgi:hypothetical protein